MDNKYVKVTENKEKDKEYWLPCVECQTQTVHRVFSSVDSLGSMTEDNYFYGWSESYQIIRCQGCRSFSFRHEASNSEDYDQDGGHQITAEIYPSRYMQRPLLADAHLLPYMVLPVYKETHFCLCAQQFILAGIGIRALVESVCKDKRATGNLYNMIEQLAGSGDLKRGEADVLQKLRFMGNSAAHEAKPHEGTVLIKAFDIVEHLLVNVYLLEHRGQQLPG